MMIFHQIDCTEKNHNRIKIMQLDKHSFDHFREQWINISDASRKENGYPAKLIKCNTRACNTKESNKNDCSAEAAQVPIDKFFIALCQRSCKFFSSEFFPEKITQ